MHLASNVISTISHLWQVNSASAVTKCSDCYPYINFSQFNVKNYQHHGNLAQTGHLIYIFEEVKVIQSDTWQNRWEPAGD